MDLLSSQYLLGLTVIYGIALAILGALGSSAVGIVALIGALVIGGLWVLRGMLEDRKSETST